MVLPDGGEREAPAPAPAPAPALHEFIATHRDLIIERARQKLMNRSAPRPTESEITHGVPLFLDQLAARLQTGETNGAAQIGASASLHGGELLKAGFTIGQVVHDYGDICQVITGLAAERGSQISNADYLTLNLCLDVAIEEAVSEYARQREQTIVGKGVEQLGFLAHELRNLINAATLAFEAVRSGSVGASGRTADLIGRSLDAMRDLVTRSLAEVRLEAGAPRREHILMATLLEEIEIAATAMAKTHGVQFSIERADADVMVEGDAQIVALIVTNLVQNACKFTHPDGSVVVRTRVTTDRVAIDVADECGGLPPGKAEDLFRVYEQRGTDRTGLGLGLAISRKGAHAIGAEVSVQNIPGTGCVFTLDLRRASAA